MNNTYNPSDSRPLREIQSDSEVYIEVLDSFDEIETIRYYWEEHCHHPNLDLDWFKAYFEIVDEAESPLVFVAKDKLQIRGILVGRLQNAGWPFRFGYFRIPSIKMRQLILPYPARIGPEDPLVDENLLNELIRIVNKKELDALFIPSQPMGTKLAEGLGYYFPWFHQVHDAWQPIWSGPLLNSFEELLQSRSSHHRYNIKRYGKKLEKRLGDNLKIVQLNSESNFDAFFQTIEEVAKLTYQRGMGLGFQLDTLHRTCYQIFRDHGILRAFILSSENKPLAFLIGILFKQEFFLWELGFDPSMANLRPGHYLFMKVLSILHEESPKVESLNFGFGDAQYKRGWVDNVTMVRRSIYLGRTWKSYIFGIPLILITHLDLLSKNLLDKFLYKEKVKRIWRKLLSK